MEKITIKDMFDKILKQALFKLKDNKYCLSIGEQTYAFEKYPILTNFFTKLVKYKETGVYVLLFYNSNKFYIGSSINIKRRIHQHLHKLNKKTHSKNFLDAYSVKDLLDFQCIIIKTKTREEAFDVEQYFLDNTNNDSNRLNKSIDARDSSKLNRTELEREEWINKISSSVKKLYDDPIYHYSVVKANKDKVEREKIKKETDPVFKQEFDNRYIKLSESMKKMHSDPLYKEKIKESFRKYWDNNSNREKHSLIIKERMQDPVYREKLVKLGKELALNEKRKIGWIKYYNDKDRVKARLDKVKETFSRAEVREKMSNSAIKRLSDPNVRLAHSIKIKELMKNQDNRDKLRLALKDRCKRVSVDGVVYPSLHDASNKIGMSRPGLKYRIESDKFPNSFYVQ